MALLSFIGIWRKMVLKEERRRGVFLGIGRGRTMQRVWMNLKRIILSF